MAGLHAATVVPVLAAQLTVHHDLFSCRKAAGIIVWDERPANITWGV